MDQYDGRARKNSNETMSKLDHTKTVGLVVLYGIYYLAAAHNQIGGYNTS